MSEPSSSDYSHPTGRGFDKGPPPPRAGHRRDIDERTDDYDDLQDVMDPPDRMCRICWCLLSSPGEAWCSAAHGDGDGDE